MTRKGRKIAADHWRKTSQELPEPGTTVLVLTSGAGLVPDVAFYNGPDAGGVRQWMLTDINLGEPVFWANIRMPEGEN